MKKGSYNCHFIGNVNNPKVVLIHGMGLPDYTGTGGTPQ